MTKSENTTKDNSVIINRPESKKKNIQSFNVEIALENIDNTKALISTKMEDIHNYVKVLDIILKDKLSPTNDVKELKKRLNKAKQDIERIEGDIQAVEQYIISKSNKHD